MQKGQVGFEVGPGSLDGVAGDPRQAPQGDRRVGEHLALRVEMRDQRRQFGERRVDDVVARSKDLQQAVGGVQGAGDAVALSVEFGDEGVEPAEELPDLFGAAGEQLVELGRDGVEVGDAAATHDGGDAGQGPLRCRECRGARQRNGVAGA